MSSCLPIPNVVRKMPATVAMIVMCSRALFGEPVQVRYVEGMVHGFLTLRAADGSLQAAGDLIQHARGTRVTSRLPFRFKDGSLQDETTVFSQRQQFRLVSNHFVQKGPAFPHPLEMSIDAATGAVTVRYTDEHGQPKEESEHLELPSDVANGVLISMLKNVRPDAAPKTLSLVVAT